MTELTVKELEEKQKEVFEQRRIYEAAKEASDMEHVKLKKLQEDHIARLESLGKTSYKTVEGNFMFRYNESFALDPEKKAEFFNYLREKELFDAMVTVNSQTLNKFAKEELEIAELEGELDYQIPGLIKKDPVAIASMRKA